MMKDNLYNMLKSENVLKKPKAKSKAILNREFGTQPRKLSDMNVIDRQYQWQDKK